MVDSVAVAADRDLARRFAGAIGMILAVEYWARALPKWGTLAPGYVAALPVITVAGVLAATRYRRWGFGAAAALHAGVVWNEFPATGNHAYLELMICALLALCDLDRDDEVELLLAAVRRLTVIVLFYSGLQKLLHGYYFGGEMLAYSLGTNSFRPVLAGLMPDGEFARLASFTGQPGDGPYRVASPAFVALSNLVWLAEMALAPMLLMPRLATAAVAAVLAMLFAIELAAREVFFGLVFANCVLLSAPRWQRPILPALVLLLAGLLASRLGILPEAVFY